MVYDLFLVKTIYRIESIDRLPLSYKKVTDKIYLKVLFAEMTAPVANCILTIKLGKI